MKALDHLFNADKHGDIPGSKTSKIWKKSAQEVVQ